MERLFPCASVKINGASLDTYAIAYTASEISQSFAKKLSRVIEERTGISLATVSIEDATGNVIVADEKRAIGADFVEGEKGYAIYVENGDLKIAISSGNSAYEALKTFEGLLVGDVEFAGDYRLVKQANVLRIAMVGASNTEHGNIGHWITTYLTTRYPDKLIDTINCGVGGDSPADAYTRLEWDVYPTHPDVVVFSFGCNRMAYRFGNETGDVDPEERKRAIVWFIEHMEKLILDAKAKGLEVIITTPTPLDEWMESPALNYINAYIGFDALSEELRKLAKKHSIDCLDYYQNITAYSRDYRIKNGGTKEITVFTDRKHVNAAGAFAFAFAFAEDSRWASEKVASICINANDGSYEADNATLDVKLSASDRVEFSYKPHSLPLPANEGYNQLVGYDMLPINERNSEIIKVTGLEDGEYDVVFDGASVTTATASALAEGVDIARLESNPSQKLAMDIHDIYKTKKANTSAVRVDRYAEENFLRKNGIVCESAEEKIALYKKALEEDSVKDWMKTCMEIYIETHSTFDGLLATALACEFDARVIANIGAYKVEIIKK